MCHVSAGTNQATYQYCTDGISEIFSNVIFEIPHFHGSLIHGTVNGAERVELIDKAIIERKPFSNVEGSFKIVKYDQSMLKEDPIANLFVKTVVENDLWIKFYGMVFLDFIKKVTDLFGYQYDDYNEDKTDLYCHVSTKPVGNSELQISAFWDKGQNAFKYSAMIFNHCDRKNRYNPDDCIMVNQFTHWSRLENITRCTPHFIESFDFDLIARIGKVALITTHG